MRSYMNLAVLALTASTVFPALSAPTPYRVPRANIDPTVDVFRRVEFPRLRRSNEVMHDHPPTRSVPPDSDEIDGYPAHLLPPYHLDETPTHGHETAPTSRPPGPTGGVPFGPHSNSINEYPPHLLPPYSLEGTHSPPPGHETAATLRQKKIIKYVGGGLGLSIIAGVTGLGVYEGIHNAHKGHNTTKRTFEAFEGQANVKLAERALGGPR